MNKQKMVAPDIKQVILVRNDLNMSAGKACAQVGHASMLFLIDSIWNQRDDLPPIESRWMFDNGPIPQKHGEADCYGGMKKIVLGVDNGVHLAALHWEALDAGLKVFNVFDEGLNEITCCAIGPDYANKIDSITGDLKLYGPPIVAKVEKSYHPFDFKFTFDVAAPVKNAFKNWEKEIAAESVIPRPRKRYHRY
jgi:PTH2 family peptidyl-tRNA hydrolase